ncbi:Uncharacterised protein [Serratia quinivorans]|nr:Uncharacterised protein [Serratia quinivorans]
MANIITECWRQTPPTFLLVVPTLNVYCKGIPELSQGIFPRVISTMTAPLAVLGTRLSIRVFFTLQMPPVSLKALSLVKSGPALVLTYVPVIPTQGVLERSNRSPDALLLSRLFALGSNLISPGDPPPSKSTISFIVAASVTPSLTTGTKAVRFNLSVGGSLDIDNDNSLS